MRELLFDEWSPDPAIREQQIALALGSHRGRSETKPRKRTATKAWDVPKEQRFWEREPWQDRYVDSLPRWVQCAEDYKADKKSWRCRREVAVNYRHVQQNCSYCIGSICADLDHSDSAARCMRGDTPPPSLICENPENGHVHVSWLLRKARKTCSVTSSIERAITRSLDGDIAFSMTGLCKNALHDHWNVTRPREEPYTLSELSSFFNAKEMKPWAKAEKRTGYGRNCTIFDDSGAYARKIVLDCKAKDWHRSEFIEHIEAVAWDMNLSAFVYPLSRSEIAEIAKKVATWTWKTFSEDGKRRWHVMKGAAGNRKRWDGHITMAQRASELGISESTLRRRLRASHSLITLSTSDTAILSPETEPLD